MPVSNFCMLVLVLIHYSTSLSSWLFRKALIFKEEITSSLFLLCR